MTFREQRLGREVVLSLSLLERGNMDSKAVISDRKPASSANTDVTVNERA